MRPLLLLPLLVAVASCVPVDLPLLAEGSGDDVMLNDAAGPEVLTLESAASGETEGKDELFHSLADLLSRVNSQEGVGQEQGGDQEKAGMEELAAEEAEEETDQEKVETGESGEQEQVEEMDQEGELEEGVAETEQHTDEVRQEQGTDNVIEERSEQEPRQETDQEAELEPGQETDHVAEQGGDSLLPPDPTVFPIQLLDIPVIPNPAPDTDSDTDSDTDTDTDSDSHTDTDSDTDAESATASAEEVTTVTERSTEGDDDPTVVPLQQNEVPLPTQQRQPVQEPIIIAEKAACLGCVTPILQDGADLRKVANMAAKLLEEELESQYTFRVTEVYRASKQVVNGIMYFLTLEVAPTSCERPAPPFTLCYVSEDAPRVVYSAEMLHQPHRANTELTTYRQLERSEVSGFPGLFAAGAAEPPTSPPARSSAGSIRPGDSLLDILKGLDAVITRQKQDDAAADEDNGDPADEAGASAGGPIPLRPASDAPARPLPIQAADDAPLLPAADSPALPLPAPERAQERHATSPESLHVQQLLREAGWSGPEKASVVGLLPIPEVEAGCRDSRQYGDTVEVPLNVAHPRVQKILHQFLERQEKSRSNRLVITDVKSATRETVSETTYRFEFTMGRSACPKNSTEHRYSCAALSSEPISNCRVRVRHRAGQPLQFNTVSCSSTRTRQCANGECERKEIHPYAPAYLKFPDSETEVDIHDPVYQQLVQHVQDEVNRRSRRPHLKKYVKTLNATKVSYNLKETSEIVDQELYSLTLRFAATSCLRDDGSDPEKCLAESRPAEGTSTSICDVRVSSLGWADRMRVLDLFCETEPERAGDPAEA